MSTRFNRSVPGVAACMATLLAVSPAAAQLADKAQTRQAEEGINKTLAEQVGAGRGRVTTPGSSIFIIERDPFRAIRRGRQLFQRKFTVGEGFGPRTGDGHGDIAAEGSVGAGLLDSCAGCHGRPRGSAGVGGNVFTRPDSRDAPHLFGLGLVEMLADEITADLRAIRDHAMLDARAAGSAVTRRLRSKGVGFGRITAGPDGPLDTSKVRGVDADLRVRPFFAEGRTISIREFIVGAFDAEMGLESADPVLMAAAAGRRVTTPSGMVLDGSTDRIEAPPVDDSRDDSDGDGVVNEIDPALVDHMEFYLLNYFKPGRDRQTRAARRGRRRMYELGCTGCHVENLTVDTDRRVADVETAHDETGGVFNQLFATAEPRFDERDDGTGHPVLKQPQGQRFTVRGIYADFKRHDLGPNFWERNFDGTLHKEFMTEPLWGVGSTGPYGHDGRSMTLRNVILRHGGEAERSRNAFARASSWQQDQLVAFLRSLILFPPDDTASNLDAGDRGHPDFPQRGHGSIALGVLFNDPTDLE